MMTDEKMTKYAEMAQLVRDIRDGVTSKPKGYALIVPSAESYITQHGKPDHEPHDQGREDER